jgi:F420-non-reducing hydrogenase iron-sulfur subunit
MNRSLPKSTGFSYESHRGADLDRLVRGSSKGVAMGFEPKIVGFLCNWCSYTGADLAGVSRIKSVPNVRIIRTMCSGRVDPAFILKAFQRGADGVVVMGCHFGDCHYQEGNYKSMRRVRFLSRLIARFGIDPRRLRLEWVSASEGDRFAEVVNTFTEEVRSLGPLHLYVHGRDGESIDRGQKSVTAEAR